MIDYDWDSVAYSSEMVVQRVEMLQVRDWEQETREGVISRGLEMIARFESFAPRAYLDTSGRYSIGYGTRSYAGEDITETEARARMRGIVARSYEKIRKDFPTESENRMVALLSLYYNCHSGYKKVRQEGFEVWLNPKFCTLPGYGGLIKRRAEERVLVFYETE